MKKRFKEFISKVFQVVSRPEMAVLPGQLAFFFVLSVVPIVTLITYGASFLNLSLDFISNFVGKAFGEEVAVLIVPMISISNVDFRYFFKLLICNHISSNLAS